MVCSYANCFPLSNSSIGVDRMMQMELRLDQDTLARQYNKELGIYEIHELWTDKDYYDGRLQFVLEASQK